MSLLLLYLVRDHIIYYDTEAARNCQIMSTLLIYYKTGDEPITCLLTLVLAVMYLIIHILWPYCNRFIRVIGPYYHLF